MQLKIVYMGSPEFAVPTLQALAKHHQMMGVVTQPDKPSGRGKKLTPPAVKIASQNLNLPYIQPYKLREEAAMLKLREWAPDLIVVAAYGQILRQEVLELPKYGCINVHASLLPRWRGASPIQAAIIHGDTQTGITIMKMDKGMDTGDILAQAAVPIEEESDAESLSQQLSLLGAELLIKTIPAYIQGEIKPQKQDESLATYAPKIEKKHGELDFSQPAKLLERQVRAYNPWPSAYTYWKGEVLKVIKARAAEEKLAKPGQRLFFQNLPAIGTIDGILVLLTVQPAGKKPMPAEQFLLGAKGWSF